MRLREGMDKGSSFLHTQDVFLYHLDKLLKIHKVREKTGDINVSFETTFATNEVIQETVLLDGSIDFHCFSQLITGGSMFPWESLVEVKIPGFSEEPTAAKLKQLQDGFILIHEKENSTLVLKIKELGEQSQMLKNEYNNGNVLTGSTVRRHTLW